MMRLINTDTENGTAVATSRLRENFSVHAHQYRTVRILLLLRPEYVHSVLLITESTVILE